MVEKLLFFSQSKVAGQCRLS